MTMETLSNAATRIGARLHGADASFERVISDTRQLRRGDWFVALVGERFDGHDFLRRAASLGAAGALVSRVDEGCELPQVAVPDTLRGLQDYAQRWRDDFRSPVVAVTGSNGKTTTKQLLAAVFESRGPVLATDGNLNNHIGVPLTLTRLRAEHRTAVIEMGANHLGEIARLAEIARPDVGVVTQAGDAHLEGFGSRDAIAAGKGELFAALGSRGIAVINADDVYAPLWQRLAGAAAVIRFGFAESADVTAQKIECDAHGSRFELLTPGGRAQVSLPLPGRHNVANALAAAACASALGLDADDIAAGLSRVRAASGRVMWKTTTQGARLLDDSYNANPSSLRAGLELLAAQAGERWAVLGTMAELGADSAALHEAAGRAARALGIERLYACGAMANAYARGFGDSAHCFDDAPALIAVLAPAVTADISLLVKGSRSARMERVVQALVGEDRASMGEGTH